MQSRKWIIIIFVIIALGYLSTISIYSTKPNDPTTLSPSPPSTIEPTTTEPITTTLSTVTPSLEPSHLVVIPPPTEPTETPTSPIETTVEPTITPTIEPTSAPTVTPTLEPTVEHTIAPTPTKTVLEINLDWKSIEKTVTKEIEGEFVSFPEYGFKIYIPNIFKKTILSPLTMTDKNHRIATYRTEDGAYSLTITYDLLPKNTQSIDDILEVFGAITTNTVCKAYINNLPFIDVEWYANDILQMVTPLRTFTGRAADKVMYLTFTFIPMSNEEYADITIAILSSIQMIPVVTPTETPEPDNQIDIHATETVAPNRQSMTQEPTIKYVQE